MKLLWSILEACIGVVTLWLLCLHAADAIALQWWQILMPAAGLGLIVSCVAALDLSIVAFVLFVRFAKRRDAAVVQRQMKARQLRRAILFLCCVGLSVPAFAAEPPAKPILLIIHSDQCPPCRVFDRVYTIDSDLRTALNRAFDVRELDLCVPSQRIEAERYGVKDVPTFLVLRNGKPVSTHRGFASTMEVAAVNRAIADLMDDLQVEWPVPKVDPPRKSPPPSPRVEPKPIASTSHPGPTIDQVARDGITKLAAQSRELQESQQKTQSQVAAIAADVQKIRSEVTESHNGLRSQIESGSRQSRTQLETISRTMRESLKSIESERVSTREELESIIRGRVESVQAAKVPADISAEMSAPGPTASKWLRVLAWAGRTGLAIAAPEVAIPGSIGLTLAGLALSWIQKRRASRPVPVPVPSRVQTEPRVVPIAVDAPPSPQRIHTETHFVNVERDTHEQAHAWAKEQLARRYPGATPTLETLDSLIAQFKEGRKE